MPRRWPCSHVQPDHVQRPLQQRPPRWRWACVSVEQAADGARTSELRHIPNMYRWRDRDRSTASDEKTVTGQRWNIITAECNFLPWTRNPIVPLCVTSLCLFFSPSILPSAIWRYPIVWDNKSAWPPRLFFYSLSLLTMTFCSKGRTSLPVTQLCIL